MVRLKGGPKGPPFLFCAKRGRLNASKIYFTRSAKRPRLAGKKVFCKDRFIKRSSYKGWNIMTRKTYSEELNFVTLTVVDWIDVFTRRKYGDFIIENLSYCRKNKGLKIYAYVLMTNHLHLIAQSENLSDILRDFKTFTSKELYKMISSNMKESKKRWIIDVFKEKGAENNRNMNHQLWQNGNYPVALYSNGVIQQKIDYVHENPVRAGFVDSPEKYYYSSANPSSPLKLDG